LRHVLGDRVGKVLQTLSEKNGVNIITSANIKEIAHKDGRQIKSVVIDGK
jgi:hypothetical protein